MNVKASRVVALGVMLAAASAVTLVSEQAWSADDSGRLEQLEARVRNLETRIAGIEAASHKQSGMMEHMMKHKQGMSKGSMSGPMGTMPQPASEMPASGAAPGPAAPMSPAGAASGGGMGDDM